MSNPRAIAAVKDLAHLMRNGLIVMDCQMAKGQYADARHRCRGMMMGLEELIGKLKEKLEDDTTGRSADGQQIPYGSS